MAKAEGDVHKYFIDRDSLHCLESFVEYLRVVNWCEVRCYQKLNTIFCNQCPRCEMFSVLVLNSKVKQFSWVAK